MGTTEHHDFDAEGGAGVRTVLWIIEIVGVIPFIGLAVRGVWDQSELGWGTLFLVLGTRELIRDYRRRRASLSTKAPHDRG